MKTWSLRVRSLLVAVATAVTLSAEAEEKSVPEVAEYAAEMNGKYYATLAKAVQECPYRPYDASETNEIKLLSDVEWEDRRTYEYYDLTDPEFVEAKQKGRWITYASGSAGVSYKHKVYWFGATSSERLFVYLYRDDDWSFFTGQKVAVDLNGHRHTNAYVQVDCADLIIRDSSPGKTGVLETAYGVDVDRGTLTLESGRLVLGVNDAIKRAGLVVRDTGYMGIDGFNFCGGEVVTKGDFAAVYVSNSCIRVGGDATLTNGTRNVVLAHSASIELLSPLTGRVGVTMEDTAGAVEGALIGSNPGGYAGAENIYCDSDPSLHGRTVGTAIVWSRDEPKAELNGRTYYLLADAVQECPYEAESFSRITLLGDMDFPYFDRREYNYGVLSDADAEEIRAHAGGYKHAQCYKDSHDRWVEISYRHVDWAFFTGQKVIVDLNGHRAANAWLNCYGSSELKICDTSEFGGGVVELALQGAPFLDSDSVLTLESGTLKAWWLDILDGGTFNFLGGKLGGLDDKPSLITVKSNAVINIGGNATSSGGKLILLENDSRLNLVSPFTGRISVMTTGKKSEGTVIGSNPSKFPGAENILYDWDPTLCGRTTEDGKIVLSRIEKTAKAVLENDRQTLRFVYDETDHGVKGAEWFSVLEAETNGYYAVPWRDCAGTVAKVVFDPSFADYRPKRCKAWFSGFESLTELDGISNLVSSAATDMGAMFFSCRSLHSLDLSHLDTACVTNMNEMFSFCSALTTLDVSGFNTANVTGMFNMFMKCGSLTSLDLSSFDTANVTEMFWMFTSCSNLTSLALPGFDTAKVKNLSHMFEDCAKLTSLDLTAFDTSRAEDMYKMFCGCSSLKTIVVSDSFVTDGVTDSEDMFAGCTALVGGSGTAYDAAMTGKTYARIDGKDGLPGYFTAKPVEYVVTFDSNGGSAVAAQTVLAGGTATKPADPAKDGFTFAGWHSDEGLTTAYDFATAVTSDLTLYAKWNAEDPEPEPPPVDSVVTNTITYLGVEGVVNTNVTTFTTNDLPLVLGPVGREGYEFLGWTPNGGVIPPGTTSNVTFTAQWRALGPEPKKMPTLFDSFAAGAVSEKGATYNGFLGEGTLGGTFTLVVKKPKKGETTATATLTRVNPKTGKKEKVTGTVDVMTGLCAGGLAGLVLNEKGVGGKLWDLAVQGAVDAAKAKDASTLGLMNGYDKSVYSVVLKGANGSTALLTATFSKKGKVKVAGTVDGVKISCSAQMSVGDRYAAVPFAYAKPAKGVAVSAVLWFDKATKALVDVTGVGKDAEAVAFGDASAPVSGECRFVMSEPDVRASVSGAISNTAYEVKATFDGKKYDAGKAAKVTYDRKTSTLAVDTSKGTDVSGLKLKYAKGAISGSFTVYEIDTTKQKLVKNKFTVNGVIVDGVGYGLATNKKLKPIPIEVAR